MANVKTKVVGIVKRNKAATILGVIVVLLLLSMFGNAGRYTPSYSDMMYESNYMATSAAPQAMGASVKSLATAPAQVISDTVATAERLVIYTANMAVEVVSVDTAFDKIKNIATNYDGYIEDSSIYRTDKVKSGYVTIKVPKDKFYNAISDIEAIGTIDSKNVGGNDVTEEYADLNARLNNYKASEKRYLELLDIAKTVDDIIKVEDRLTDVRYNIDSLEGRIKRLSSRIEMSSISVNLHEPAPLSPEIKWDQISANIVSGSILGFLGSIQSLIILIATWLPVIIVVLVIWKIYKRRNKKKR